MGMRQGSESGASLTETYLLSNAHQLFLDATRRGESAIEEALDARVVSFECLAGLSADAVPGLLEDPSPLSSDQIKAIHLLTEISALTQEDMEAMNQAHPGLPPDTLAKTMDLVTRPGASVVVLTGDPDANFGGREQLLGYGIVIAGKENFPEWSATDPDHRIPDELFEGRDHHHRLIRLFVRDSARDQEAAGKAFDRIINRIKDLCHDEPIIALVLTDLIPLGNRDSDNPLDKRIWLAAKAALERRGFEDAGCGYVETIEENGTPNVAIPFRWHTFPARSEAGRREYEESRANYEKLEANRKTQLASVVPRLPLAGSTVLYDGTEQGALALAVVCGNVILAERFLALNPKENTSARRMNLIHLPEGTASYTDLQLDAIVINGVLPDIERRSDDPNAAIKRFLSERVGPLKEGGSLLIRDTVGPTSDEPLKLYLGNGEHFTTVNGNTAAQLFEEFVASQIESHIPSASWTQVNRLPDTGELACFSAPADIVAEFLLKYRYIEQFPEERFRPYTLHTPEQRLALGEHLGLRLLHAGPEFNPYVLEQHQRAGIAVRASNNESCTPLSTNYVSTWQKVAPGEGVRITPGNTLPQLDRPFVTVRRYDEVTPTGEVVGSCEIATRPGNTYDVIPYWVDHTGRLYVWGRELARPISNLHPRLDKTMSAGYLIEQVAGIVEPSPLTRSPESHREQVAAVYERGTEHQIPELAHIHEPSRYFVKPDTVDEVVTSTAVEIAGSDLPLFNTIITDPQRPFGGRYALRAFEGVALLQGAQVGHFSDPRLERKVYQLLLENDLSCGAWLGERVALRSQQTSRISPIPVKQLLEQRPSTTFRLTLDQTPHFLGTHRQEFIEETADSAPPRTRVLEYVQPRQDTGLSHQSISVLAVAKTRNGEGVEEIVVGLEVRNFPAVQEELGKSSFITIPTARLPLRVTSLEGAYEFGTAILEENHGITSRQAVPLGGKYFVSPGITPEVIYPLVIEVNFSEIKSDSLKWVRLNELIPLLPELHCAQLLTSTYRAAHLLGTLPKGT